MESSHEKILDTRQFENPTEFVGSGPHDTAVARHFWMPVHLHPHLESRLVSDGVKQRLRTSNGGKGSRASDPDMSKHYAENEKKSQLSERMAKEASLAKFKERKERLRKQYAARRWNRLVLEDKSGQLFQRYKDFDCMDLQKIKDRESRVLADELQEEIAKFEKSKTVL